MLESYNAHSSLPEQRLFRAIITQALEDAHYTGTIMIDMRDKESAINWFLDLGKDYRTICDYAGFSPMYIRDAFVKARARGLMQYTERQTELLFIKNDIKGKFKINLQDM
jgi:hypothetical protein